jgi:hypothetical protein
MKQNSGIQTEPENEPENEPEKWTQTIIPRWRSSVKRIKTGNRPMESCGLACKISVEIPPAAFGSSLIP